MTCVAAKAMPGTLRPDNNNAASKRTETKRENDGLIKFDLDTQESPKRFTKVGNRSAPGSEIERRLD